MLNAKAQARSDRRRGRIRRRRGRDRLPPDLPARAPERPAFAGARASLEAGLEKLPQGRALLLPVINGTANTTYNDVNNRLLGQTLSFNSNGYAITLTQPIFRWQNIVQYKQSEFQVLQSEAQFGQATQDLIVRVAQAYFDVLAAQDNLDFTIGEQDRDRRAARAGEAQLRGRHRDHHRHDEAQARYDLATAQEIAGRTSSKSRSGRCSRSSATFRTGSRRSRRSP